MRDGLTLTLAEVYALVADLDVTTFEYVTVHPPIATTWDVALRTCADMQTAIQRLREAGIAHRVDDELRAAGRFFGGALRTTAWAGPGRRWTVIHVHHNESPCGTAAESAEVEPEQDALPIGGAA